MRIRTLVAVLGTVLFAVGVVFSVPSPAFAALTEVTTSTKAGVLDLLSTQDKDLPGFKNTSDKAVTVKVQAEGKWSVLPQDKKARDEVAKFQPLVSADGYGAAAPDNFALMYPEFKPGALVAEITDAQGKKKSVLSGKDQSFELQPGESVSFIMNDDPKYYNNNSGSMKLNYSLVTGCSNSQTPDPLPPNPLPPNPVTPCSVSGSNAAPEFLVNLPYKSFATDSPFKSLKASSDWFEFESFDGPGFALKAPGVKASASNETAKYTDPGFFDSVDEDDKALDGKGRGQDRLVLSNGDITFTFDSTRGFPTDAGIVWTDFHGSDPSFGQGKLTFEAFDASGASLGVQGPFVIGGDYSTTGETGEDRFFGVHYNGGISKFRIVVPGVTNGIEFDHLQYGRKCR